MTNPTGFSPGFEESAETFCADLPAELDSSGSMNVQEPPGKVQRSESGGMPTSSQKSQSVRPACEVVKARADAQEEKRREIVQSRGPRQDPRSPNVSDHSPRSGTQRRESGQSAESSRAQSSPTAAADVESIVSSVSVTSSNMLERHEALIRARELNRKRRELRETQAELAAQAETANRQLEAEAANRQLEAEAVSRQLAAQAETASRQAVNRRLEAELEDLEFDAQIAELSSKMSSASERSHLGGSRTAMSEVSSQGGRMTADNVQRLQRTLAQSTPVAPLPRPVLANTSGGKVSNEQGEIEENVAIRTATFDHDARASTSLIIPDQRHHAMRMAESSATCCSAAQRQVQSFQQNVTHVHGDMIAQQNNIDVKLVEQNIINLAETRHETAINEVQQTVVNIAETRHENVVNNLKQEAAIHYENKVLEVVS